MGFLDSIKDAIRGGDDARKQSGTTPPEAPEPVGGAHADRTVPPDAQESPGSHAGPTGGKHAAPVDQNSTTA